MATNYMGGSKNAYAKRARHHQADLTGTPVWFQSEGATSAGAYMKQQKGKSKPLGVTQKRSRPQFDFQHAPPLRVAPEVAPLDLEAEEEIEEYDEAAMLQEQKAQRVLRDEYEASQPRSKGALSTDLELGVSATRRTCVALLSVPDWSGTAPKKSAPKHLKPALKPPSHAIQVSQPHTGSNSTRGKVISTFRLPPSLLVASDNDRPEAGGSVSAAMSLSNASVTRNPFHPYEPLPPKPRYQARRARSPPTDEARSLVSLPVKGSYERTSSDDRPLFNLTRVVKPRRSPTPAPPSFSPEESQPSPDFLDVPHEDDGSEPMDLGSDQDEEEEDGMEILSFGSQQRGAVAYLTQEISAASSISAPAHEDSVEELPAPVEKPEDPPSASLDVAPPSPRPPSPPPAFPDASHYLAESSLDFWNTLRLSMNEPALPSCSVKPLRVGWTSVCCATKKQRQQLSDMLIFDQVDTQQHERGNEWVVEERMGLGCRGVRRENAGRLDKAMLNVGWDDWMDDEDPWAGHANNETRLDDEDNGVEIPEVEPLWKFALEPVAEMELEVQVGGGGEHGSGAVKEAEPNNPSESLDPYSASALSSPTPPARPQTLTALNISPSPQSQSPTHDATDMTRLLLAVKLDSAEIKPFGPADPTPDSSPDPLAPKGIDV